MGRVAKEDAVFRREVERRDWPEAERVIDLSMMVTKGERREEHREADKKSARRRGRSLERLTVLVETAARTGTGRET